MLCWAANLVEAYNKEVRVGFKDRVMVLLRPSKGGGVEDMYKLTKGRSVNFFHVLHLCKTWNFCTFSTKAHFFMKTTIIPTAAILDYPPFPAVLKERPLKRHCFRLRQRLLTIRVTHKLYRCTLPSSGCALGLCTVK